MLQFTFRDGNISLLHHVRSIMIFLGVLPYQLVNFNKRIYIYHKYIIQGIFFFALILYYLGIPQFHDSSDQLFKSIGILITYSILYIKGLVCISKNMSELILDMVSYESKINTEDAIYKSIVKRSNLLQKYYIILTYFTGTSFFVQSIIYTLTVEAIETDSNSRVHRSLPYRMWMPLDESEHYFIALGLQICFTVIAINYYCFIQCILVILPLNMTLRLKILASNLKQIKYSKNLSSVNCDVSINLESINEKVIICIKEHMEVIGKCSILNDTIQYLMLLEFLFSSTQACIALILLTTTKDTNIRIFSVLYLLQLLTQLLILYWHADEIREENMRISNVLYDMQWFDFNKSINTSIQIMMVRSQIPLSLTVGPFGEMSLEMYVQIIKAAYAYLMFMRQVYGEK